MSVKIRFTRLGKPKNPFYRIVVMDSRKPRDSEYLDKVGHVNPLVKKKDRSYINFHLDKEKIISWLKKGAQPTQVVLDLLKQEKIWEDFSKEKLKKRKNNKRKSHSKTISEMLKRRQEKKKIEEAKQRILASKPKEEKTEEKDEIAKVEGSLDDYASKEEIFESVSEVKGDDEIKSEATEEQVEKS